jgi:hypothetical protein
VNRIVAFLAVLLLPAASLALVLPPEQIQLTQIHVQFEWPVVVGADDHELWVVEDDGSPDPFDGAAAVVDESVGGGTPRAAVTSGLAFDKAYAWRVRGVLGSPLSWGPTHRFDILPLPASFPTFFTTFYGGAVEPGFTLINLNGFPSSPTSFAAAITDLGEVVWYLPLASGISDFRLLDNGRLLGIFGIGVETTLNGQIAWMSPPEITIHHEIFPMPNGNYMALGREYQEVTSQSVTKQWSGDRILEFDHDDNSVVWEWSTFANVSTQDYDQDLWDNSPPTSFDWTHSNAVVYNSADDSVYLSIRHLSRIVRIDYATQQIVYNMGFTMPSGDDDFGDNLFSFQHAPEMQPNGNMVLFDNGNRRDHIVHNNATGVTKAVELALTGNPPTSAAIVWDWTLPGYNRAKGDADRLPNGNTLLTAAKDLTVHEVNATGTEVWRVEIGLGPVSYKLYRAERVPTLLLDVPGDADADGIADYIDNCPDHPNVDQTDFNDDGFGDTCAAALGIPVPEPTSQLALAVGCGALAILKRRRTQRLRS